MQKFYQIPLYRLCKIIATNGGFSLKSMPHLAPWVIKTTLFEPLRWIETIKYSKKINKYTIEHHPVFILGYYRSGTTYLQRMFMQDKAFGYTSIFQTVLPEIMLTFEKRLTPLLDKASRTFKLRNHFHRIPFSWHDFPGEEDVALTAMLDIDAFQWGTLFPERFYKHFEKNVLMKDVPSSSIEDWKKGYMFFLKKVSIANNHRQLVLKNPPNTARIKLLLSLFPDAKFIHIVRNPFDVFASNRRFWEVIRNNYVLGSTRSVNTDRLILDSYAGIMQQYQEQKELIPQKRLVEISYEDFIDQPVQTMRNLYSKLELGDFELCKPAMINFVDQQKKYELLHHRLDKESKNLIVQKWDPYIKLWIGLNNSQSYITPTE